jgi:branched-chain amino acid transport system ATP-binding protein
LEGTKLSFLSIRDLSLSFGGIKAINNCSFDVEKLEIFSLIGPNGAGKTSVFNVISGFYKPDNGNIYFNGEDLTKLKPYQIAMKGIGRTFQNVELFKKMTTIENVLVGYHQRIRSGILAGAFSFPASVRNEGDARREAMEILGLMKLDQVSNTKVVDLPFGTQKKIEIARALASNPQILLLDEPAAGLNTQETKDLMMAIKGLQRIKKITILLVEHDMKVVMGLSDKICVLHFGEKIAEGTPREVQSNQNVRNAYLGEKREYL